MGILVTYFFVPDMTGVDFADEDAKFMNYFVQNGWEGALGEDDEKALVRKGISSRDSDEEMSENTDSTCRAVISPRPAQKTKKSKCSIL